MTEEKETTIREEILGLKDVIRNENQKKQKPFRMPWGARVSRGKLKRGYLTVAVINDNMSVDFVKEPIIDGTVKLGGDSYHSVEEFDIFSYKGKPFIFQPKSKLNPYNPLRGEHETYGQKYVMARLEGERLTTKKQLGWGISIGVLIIVGIVVYALVTGGS